MAFEPVSPVPSVRRVRALVSQQTATKHAKSCCLESIIVIRVSDILFQAMDTRLLLHRRAVSSRAVEGGGQGAGGSRPPPPHTHSDNLTCSSWCDGSSDRSFMVDPLGYFWCNKRQGICYPVCRIMHIKEPLLLIGKSSPCGGRGFPRSLYEWFVIIILCLTPYNRKERDVAQR